MRGGVADHRYRVSGVTLWGPYALCAAATALRQQIGTACDDDRGLSRRRHRDRSVLMILVRLMRDKVGGCSAGAHRAGITDDLPDLPDLPDFVDARRPLL